MLSMLWTTASTNKQLVHLHPPKPLNCSLTLLPACCLTPTSTAELSLFTYDWRRAGEEGASRAPEGPASARSSLTSGTSVAGPAATLSSAGTYGVAQVPPPGASPFQPLGRAASGQYTARTWGGSDAGA